MALFEDGREKTGGRQKGTPNKKTILRAAAVLAANGISPTEKLIEIADNEETPIATRVELWKFLQTYVEAPQTIAVAPAPDSPEESVERAKMMAERLSRLSEPLEPSKPDSPQP